MRRLIRITGFLIGALLILFLVFAAYIIWSPMPTYENLDPEIVIEKDSAMIAEGARIAMMTCANCHRSSDGKLGGAFMEDMVPLGKVYAPNITQHPDKGIADYSIGELAYLLRTGVTRDGRYTPPWMTKFPNMADEDLKSIIAFLKSGHPLVQPSDNEEEETKYYFLGKALIKLKAFGPLPYPGKVIERPNPENKVAFGRYLATAVYDCYGCHSPDFKTQNLEEPEKTPGYFTGGNPVVDREGNVVMSANLTMDSETGIGGWTREQFIRNLKYGIKPDGSGSNKAPMIPFSLLSDEEAGAIFEYLRSLPPVRNEDLL